MANKEQAFLMSDLINAVAERTGEKKNHTRKMIRAIFQEIQEKLGEGKNVKLVGFGSWNHVEIPARHGKVPDPNGGEPKEVEIPAYTRLFFRSSGRTQDLVNGQ